jgi:hypothetical protein
VTTTAETHVIQDQRVTLPVEIREAAVASAMFPVPARTTQAIIAYSGLEVAQPLPGKAICSLAFIRYADGDLGPYHEFAVAFLVRPPGSPPLGGALDRLRDLKRIGAFIHWLPVNQTFTLEAGRSIWGFPKEIADIPIDLSGRVKRCAVRLDGRTALELAVRPGFPMPGGAGTPAAGVDSRQGAGGNTVDAYSCLDGVTRLTPWTMAPSGVRTRPGGATLRLGEHPVADELRRLGLDGAHALSTSTISRLAMSFAAATEVAR